MARVLHIGRSGWNSGEGRMASAEGGLVLSGVGYGEPTRGSGERSELPQRGLGQSPCRKRILAYLKVTERSRTKSD